MESQIDSIDKKIEHLRNTIIEKYNKSMIDIDKNISYAKEAAFEKAVQNRAALIKELDDRLDLIKKFPSVLEADLVKVETVEAYSGSYIAIHNVRTDISNIYFPAIADGNMDRSTKKWKILILVKRIDET